MGVYQGFERWLLVWRVGFCDAWGWFCPFFCDAAGVECSEDFGGSEGGLYERRGVDFGVCCCSIAASVAKDDLGVS